MLAIDIGGTKLAAGIVAPDGEVLKSERAPTPQGPGADAEVLWAALDTLVSVVLAGGPGSEGPGDPGGVGIGCGGPMIWPDGIVSPLNIPGWRDFPLRDRLRERFPGLPVRLHNDATCLAAAEHWRGSGRGTDDLLGMVVSTGVGGGLVLGGRLVDGAAGNAGHIGHVVVDPDGPRCACGGYGCLEAIASGPRVVAWARERGWRAGDPDAGAGGRELTEDARNGAWVAVAALRRAGAALGVAIASSASLLDLQVVAVGGGLSQAGQLLFGPMLEQVERHARLPFLRELRVVPAQLGQTAGLVGAAALVLAGDRYWNPSAGEKC